LAEVAGADDDHGPVVGQAEFATNLVDEIRNLVADTACAVTAEVAQVLADLGRIDPAQLGKLLRRDAVDAFVSLLGEDAQIHRQACHRGVRDAASSSFGGHTESNVRHSCTRSQRQRQWCRRDFGHVGTVPSGR
jgi:hypothetical protein